MPLKQVITIALSEEEYNQWKDLKDKYSQHDIFIEGLNVIAEAESRKKG